jgi:hypothetical protein
MAVAVGMVEAAVETVEEEVVVEMEEEVAAVEEGEMVGVEWPMVFVSGRLREGGNLAFVEKMMHSFLKGDLRK